MHLSNPLDIFTCNNCNSCIVQFHPPCAIAVVLYEFAEATLGNYNWVANLQRVMAVSTVVKILKRKQKSVYTHPGGRM